MPTPTKPYAVITGEKKSHRTIAELKQREQAEKELLTGEILKEHPEVKKNKVAHKEFIRLKKLLTNIGKNDAIYEQIINRYCIIYSECVEYEIRKESFYRDLEELTEDKERLTDETKGEISLSSYYKMKNSIQANIINLDKLLQSKRKMLMDIEKENIMTIASALRNIPKKQEKASNPLLDALKHG